MYERTVSHPTLKPELTEAEYQRLSFPLRNYYRKKVYDNLREVDMDRIANITSGLHAIPPEAYDSPRAEYPLQDEPAKFGGFGSDEDKGGFGGSGAGGSWNDNDTDTGRDTGSSDCGGGSDL